MAIFIQTDSDESMLAAMETAREIEAERQQNFGAELVSAAVDFNEQVEAVTAPLDQGVDILDRLDRGVPTGSLTDHDANMLHLAAFATAEERAADYSSGRIDVEAQADRFADQVFDGKGIKSQEVKHFSLEAQCTVLNGINKFNSGIDHSAALPEDAMKSITRQGLSSSMFLFTAMGFPLE